MSADEYLLIEVSSDAGTARLPVRGASMTIGRAPDNDVVLNGEQTVSRRHAEFVLTEAGWTIRDLASSNGTHLNGVRLDADASPTVTTSDVVGVGSVTLRLRDAGDVAAGTVKDSSAAEMHRLLTALSARETEVLAAVAAGMTDEQAARHLFISIKTVHSHLDRIRDKTGVRRRAELTRLAVRLGLSSPSADAQ